MANKWLVALKAKNTPHNTPTTLREADDGDTPAGGEIGQTPEKPLAKTAKITSSDKVDTPTPSKNGSDPQKPLAKTAKIPERPKKRTPRKKKLTSEEEEKHRSQLARTFPAYVYTAERAKEVLEWVRQVPEVALDIETYGRLKRDGLLYTRCQVRLIQLHHDGTSFFIDCNHVPDELVVEILSTLKHKSKYLHNAPFDIPRLYRRFGVLLDENVYDTLIASRVARAGEWERKKGRITQISHSLDDVLIRELGAEIPKDSRLKWGGLLTEEHLRYAGDDISHLKALHDALMGVLEKNGVKDRYDAVVARLPDFIGAAVRGIPLDAGRLEPILDGLESEIWDLGARLDELAPEHPEGGAWVWGTRPRR